MLVIDLCLTGYDIIERFCMGMPFNILIYEYALLLLSQQLDTC